MKPNNRLNQIKVLQKYLTQGKWWTNPKLEGLWVTTQLNTKALVIYIFKGGYILLDKHYNQIKVHESRIRESYEEVIQKHDKLCKLIVEISPKSKKKKYKATGSLTDYIDAGILILGIFLTHTMPQVHTMMMPIIKTTADTLLQKNVA